jgi:hypothetical protein
MAVKFLASVDLQKNELLNAAIQNLASDPSSPVQGQIYYNTANDVIKYYDGAAWVTLSISSGTVTAVTGSGAISSSGGNTPNITIADASTTVKGAVQLEDSYSSTSTSKAATPAAVKAAYDLANGKANPSDTTFIGTTSVALNRTSANLALTGISSIALPGSSSGTTTLQPAATAGGTVTLPASTGTLALTSDIPSLSGYVTETGTQTLTNKTLTAPVVDGSGVIFEGATADAFETTLTVVDPSADRTITLPNATGTVALTSDKLSAFAATSSSELAGVISDETGTGALVFANTPTLVTPNIGAATGTSLVLSGDLTVNGTTTTVNSTTVTIDDKNLELGSVASPTDAGADGGGITLKGTTDKTLNWVDATDAWTSSEHVNLLTGKAYYISGTSVLSSTTLGSGVTGSSLTSVGTIGTGVWQGTAIASTYGGALRYNTSATWTAGEAKTITHNLGTKAVQVSLYDSGDNQVFADVVTATTNTLTVTISLAGTYRVVVNG